MTEEPTERVFAVIDQTVPESTSRCDPGVVRVLLGVERRSHLEGEVGDVGLVEEVGPLITNQERRAACEVARSQVKAGFFASFANSGLDKAFVGLTLPAGETPAASERLVLCAL